MARAAAIVDMDRTRLTGRPGRILGEALHRSGVAVAPGPLRPAIEAAGTASLSMQLSLLAVQASRGWPDAPVREAATIAAEAVVDVVAPYLRPLLDDHRSAGERLLLVSAAPPAVAEPLGGLLGAEDVVATTGAGGRGLLAPILGPLVWARSKADAGAAWLRSARVSPSAAHVYADNFFAGPLLASVGHATAVDPDARLTALARTRGWPIRHLDVPEGVVKVAGRELQEWLRPFAGVGAGLKAHIEIGGLEHVPGRDGAILAFNHRSYFDAAVVGMVAAQAGRAVRGLGKKEVLDAPVLGLLARAGGKIRVDRGTGSHEPLEAAALALRAGEVVMIAPQGTIPPGPDDEGARDPDGPVGDRAGLAQERAAASHRPASPSPRDRADRAAGGSDVRRPGHRHQADHGRPHRPAAAGGPRTPDPDRGRAPPCLPTRLPRRPGPRA